MIMVFEMLLNMMRHLKLVYKTVRKLDSNDLGLKGGLQSWNAASYFKKWYVQGFLPLIYRIN